MKYYTIFAQAYGSSAYGNCTYANGSSNTACVEGAGTGTSTSNGGLADTGIAVLAFASFACLIIFAAIMIRFWRRSHKLAPQEVEASAETPTEADRPQPLQ